MMELLKTFGAALKLTFGLQPKATKAVRPMTHFWWVVLIGIALSIALQTYQYRHFKLQFGPQGLMGDAFFALLTLGVSVLILQRFRKAYLAFSFACFLLLVQWLPATIWTVAYDGFSEPRFYLIFVALYAAWFALAIFATLKFFQVLEAKAPRAALTVVILALLIWPLLPQMNLTSARYVSIADESLFADEAVMLPPRPSFDAEAVMYAQRSMLETELARIKPGIADVPELFVLAVAGDGKEDTFLNEVMYAKALFSKRFGAYQRALVLANHPETTAELPLASLTNLRAGLKGMAQKMQPEDALLLFMTSHGQPGPGHEFALDLMPLPLNQINPTQLAGALKASNIAHQWVVVSACYSGGYLDALASPDRIVMTAARADRSSFGCGNTEDMTYFGKAFLLDALNQQDDLLKAFQVAETAIQAREKAEGFEPSLPQIRIGDNARKHMSEWKKSFEPGEPVPFFTADLEAKQR